MQCSLGFYSKLWNVLFKYLVGWDSIFFIFDRRSCLNFDHGGAGLARPCIGLAHRIPGWAYSHAQDIISTVPFEHALADTGHSFKHGRSITNWTRSGAPLFWLQAVTWKNRGREYPQRLWKSTNPETRSQLRTSRLRWTTHESFLLWPEQSNNQHQRNV